MKNTSISRLLVGGGVVLFGALALLGSLGIINFSQLVATYWPLALILGGFILLIENRRENYLWSIVLLGGGLTALLNNLNIFDVNVWQLFWPIAIMAVGVTIIMQRARLSSNSSQNINAILSGFETKNNSKNYQSSRITAFMGGGTLDLRKATINKEATIDILAIMGGVELQVPEDWDVRVSVMPILGGVENKTSIKSKSNSPILNVVGTTVMGGIDIKN